MIYDVSKLRNHSSGDILQYVYETGTSNISILSNPHPNINHYEVIIMGDLESFKSFPLTKDGFEKAIEYFELLIYKSTVPEQDQKPNPSENKMPPIGSIIIKKDAVVLKLSNKPTVIFDDSQYDIDYNIFTSLRSSDWINQFDKFYIDIRSKRTKDKFEEYDVYPLGDADLNDNPKEKINKESVREVQKQEMLESEENQEESDIEPTPTPTPKEQDTSEGSELYEDSEDDTIEIPEDNSEQIKEVLSAYYGVSDYNKLLSLFNGKEGLLEDIENALDPLEEAKLQKDLSPYLDINQPISEQLNNIL